MKIVTGFIICFLFTFTVTFSQVTIIFAPTTDLPQSTACENGDPGGFITLSTILIAETSNNDFSAGGDLILLAPANWQFDLTSTPSATLLSILTDLSVTLSGVTALTVTYSVTVNSTANIDALILHAAVPRVIRSRPSGLNFMTCWPRPSAPRASVVQTFPCLFAR